MCFQKSPELKEELHYWSWIVFLDSAKYLQNTFWLEMGEWLLDEMPESDLTFEE